MSDKPKRPERDPAELSATEKAILERWSQGPTHFLKDGNRWWRVHYRSREPGTDDEWTEGYIDKVCKTSEFAGRHVRQKIAEGHRLQVEILRVEDMGNERAIETGKEVDVVSNKEFAEIALKRDIELAENQKELDDEMYARTTTREWSKPPAEKADAPNSSSDNSG